MPALGPVYLIHGDDHGGVAGRRAKLRELSEGLDGGASIEVLDTDAATPAGVASALAAMTLAIGRRVIIVDGVERWREKDVETHLSGALEQMPPDTTLAMFAREEGRAKAPAALHKLVKATGGQVSPQMTIKPWELGKWVQAEAPRLGLRLDAAAARTLVEQVGTRQQRLLRELEKLALEGDPGEGPRTVGAQEIEERSAHSSESVAYALADALVGASPAQASSLYMELRGQGERLAGLTYVMSRRLRDALAISERLQAGEPAAAIRSGLRMPAKAASRLMADVARSDPERLRSALVVMAELELNCRGGAPLRTRRSPTARLDEDTIALRAIEAITS